MSDQDAPSHPNPLPGVTPQLPQFRSHKIVQAAKITGIYLKPTGAIIDLADGSTVDVSLTYIQKHEPEKGGYFVIYPDGYQSFSPAASFEEGYTSLSSPLYYEQAKEPFPPAPWTGVIQPTKGQLELDQDYTDERLTKQIENAFTYHSPKGDQAKRYFFVRSRALELAYLINIAVPNSREKSSALTRLEEAVMHANAGIARNE